MSVTPQNAGLPWSVASENPGRIRSSFAGIAHLLVVS
jgi:hypothetical protein